MKSESRRLFNFNIKKITNTAPSTASTTVTNQHNINVEIAISSSTSR